MAGKGGASVTTTSSLSAWHVRSTEKPPLLLKAFAQGPASDPNAPFGPRGEGSLAAQLEGQAKSLGLSRQSTSWDCEPIFPTLGAMDVFVLSSDYEGNPLSVMEAWPLVCPSLGTAAGACRIFSRMEGDFLVQPGDVKGFPFR